MFVDTHCHLNMMVDKKRDEIMSDQQIVEVGGIIENAFQEGVSHIVNVGTSLNETVNSLQLAKRYKNVFATAGIHPCDTTDDWRQQLADLTELIKNERNQLVAIGETGLDFYHKPFNAGHQANLFEGHIELALEHDLPLVVHVREAGDEALKILELYKDDSRGVLHCFSLDLASAEQIASWGDWYIGIDGPVTYPKNDWLREVVSHIPLEHILLETDSPFLPPQSRRGKQNSPVYLPQIAECIAQERDCAIEQVAKVTTANARSLFEI